MSDFDLDEIRARADAATAGPWRWRNSNGDVNLFGGGRSWVVMAFERMGMQRAQPVFRGLDNLLYPAGKENLYDFADAQFIAHARTDVPALLAEVDRLRAENAGLRESMLKQMEHYENRLGHFALPYADSPGYEAWRP